MAIGTGESDGLNNQGVVLRSNVQKNRLQASELNMATKKPHY